jgi:hypothetical protein
MFSSRRSLVLFLGMLAGGLFVLLSQDSVCRNGPLDQEWKNHPALAEPDGRSHRGGNMVASEINDRRILLELSRRFRQTQTLQLVQQGGKTITQGTEDFERRQEYLLRLLDYYWFSKQRLLGMTWAEVETVFGPLGPKGERAYVSAGRDTLCLWFREESAVAGGAAHTRPCSPFRGVPLLEL